MAGDSFTYEMPAIALATYAPLPDLAPDEPPLIAALATLGVEAVPAVWDDARVDWSEFDAVVIRSCWDYHLRANEFFRWVDAVAGQGLAVWNPPTLLRWNSRKTYLHDLAAAGVRVVPTIWLERHGPRGPTPSLETVLARAGWECAVVKPIVSASAHETWKVSLADLRANAREHDARLHALVAGEGAMVQPFVPEIEARGEWSLQFFGGVFSHAVVKRARAGDFRVQREYGGTHERCDPPAPILAAAERTLRAAPGATIYARVDGVVIDHAFVLTELELLEPSLFLDADPAAPMRFASAIASLLGSRR